MKSSKKQDIFGGCCSPIFIILGVILLLGILAPSPFEQIFFIIFFFALGGSCLWNYSHCGRVHCQITGFGFIGVGILALLNFFNIINIAEGILWLIFFIVLGVGYGYEFLYKEKTGSSYRK